MALDENSTYELTALIAELPRPPLAMWNTFFNTEKVTDKVEVLIEELAPNSRRLARAVKPQVTPVPRKRTIGKIKKYTTGYFQERVIITPQELNDRLQGEALGGDLTADSRLARLLNETTAKLMTMFDNRMEQLSCSTLINGSYTLAYEDYPLEAMNFGRSGALTVSALTGNDRWWINGTNLVGSTADPVTVIQAGIDLQYNTSYATTTDIVLGANARKGFLASPKVKELMDNNYRNSNASFNIEPKKYQGLKFLGYLADEIKVWSYKNTYEDESDTVQDFFDPNKVVFVDAGTLGGMSVYGLIQNMDSLQSLPIFANAYPLARGKGLEVILESAPLIVPSRINSTLTMTVAS